MRLTIAHLARAKKEGKLFYIGCGFHRPHAAYITTDEHWATYDGKAITAVKHRTMHPSVPPIAMIVNFGIGLENGSHYQWNPIDRPVPVEVQIEVRRHYYAAISWMDELVGGVVSTDLVQSRDLAVMFCPNFIGHLSRPPTLLFQNASQLNALDNHGFTDNTVVIFHAGWFSMQLTIHFVRTCAPTSDCWSDSIDLSIC